MAGSLIDSLLQTVAPARAANPPRGSDGRGTFAPVFGEALQADSPGPANRPTLGENTEREDLEQFDPIDAAAAGVDNATGESDADVFGAPSDNSAANEQDPQATENEEGTAAVEGDDDSEDQEPDADEVEISAAAEAAAEAEAATVVPSTMPVGAGAGALAVDIEAATFQDEADDDIEASHRLEQASRRSAATEATEATELEFGDVLPKAQRGLGEAPANLDALEPAVATAAAKAAQVSGTADASVGREDAGAPTAKAARGKASDTAPDQGGETASDETTQRTTDASEGVDPSDGEKAGRVKTAASVVSQQNDATLTNGNGSPAARTEGATASGDSANVAAPAVAATNNGETGTTARSAAAIARLSADRSLPTAAGNADDVDRSRFVGRVEGAIRTAQQRDGRVQVRLSPPELGALRIELTMQHGVLSARLEAETPAARNLLLDNLPALRERLAQQEVRIDRFDVDVRRDGGGSAGGQQQHGAHDQLPQETAWRQAQQRHDRGAAAAKIAAPLRRIDPTTDAALDVRV